MSDVSGKSRALLWQVFVTSAAIDPEPQNVGWSGI
jgi:hypothetical protein